MGGDKFWVPIETYSLYHQNGLRDKLGIIYVILNDYLHLLFFKAGYFFFSFFRCMLDHIRWQGHIFREHQKSLTLIAKIE